jgi:hypothetical protein
MLTVAFIFALSVLQGVGFAIGMIAGAYSLLATASLFVKKSK